MQLEKTFSRRETDKIVSSGCTLITFSERVDTMELMTYGRSEPAREDEKTLAEPRE